MYPKKKYIQLVQEIWPTLILDLKLEDSNIIEVFICKSTDKEYIKDSSEPGQERGLSFIYPDGSAKIYLLWDLQNNEVDALGTLFHELLHIKLYPLTRMLLNSKKKRKAAETEEQIVRDLESFFLGMFRSTRGLK